MVNRTTVQFFLNQEQAKDAKTVMKTLKNAGGRYKVKSHASLPSVEGAG